MESVSKILTISVFGLFPIIYFLAAITLFLKNVQTKRNAISAVLISPFILAVILALFSLSSGQNDTNGVSVAIVWFCALPFALFGALYFHKGLPKGKPMYQVSKVTGYLGVATFFASIIAYT